MKSILDPAFRYTPAVQTDIRKTFKRIQKEQRDAAEAKARDEAEKQEKVRELKRGAK